MVLPFISVIICTHNRAACLGRAIDSLLGQEYPCFEVLVVDNASADATRSVVQTRSRDDQRLTYVYEARLGLSAARNRGAALAQGELLVYLDDDAEAGDGWLAAFAMGFLNYPQAEIAGGRVSLVWPQDFEVPRWLSLDLKASLGAYDLGQEPRLIEDAKQTPRGLNYAIRKSFLEQVGGFTLHLGRIGTQLLSNEELHMTQQALEMGLGVVYLPDALVYHHVSPERLNPRWFLRRSWWQGMSEYHREQLSQPSAPSATFKGIRTRCLGCLRGIAKAWQGWPDPAYRFENLVYAYGQLGYLWSHLKGWGRT